MGKYTIGLDFGTLSGRALLVDVHTGRELAEAESNYPHAVMERALPDGTPLGADWALQHPQDYLDALYAIVPAVIEKSGVNSSDIIGMGIDFTSCTVMPVDKNGVPLCMLPQWAGNPHAYVKLWKHHAAQKRAHEMTRIAKERGEKWLANYGGTVSSEWSFPKLWEVLDEAPDVYAAMDEWVEAQDWLVRLLTGERVRSACAAGYKSFYNRKEGYPDPAFLPLSIRGWKM